MRTLRRFQTDLVGSVVSHRKSVGLINDDETVSRDVQPPVGDGRESRPSALRPAGVFYTGTDCDGQRRRLFGCTGWHTHTGTAKVIRQPPP